MPATRSGKSSSKGKRSSHSRDTIIPDNDVIVISSDDESPDTTAIQLQKANAEIRSLKRQLLNKEVKIYSFRRIVAEVHPNASRRSLAARSVTAVLSQQGNQQSAGHSSFAKKSDGERYCLETLLQQATADIKKLRSSLQAKKETIVLESVKISKLKERANKAERENVRLMKTNQELLNRISGIENKCLHKLEEHILCEICEERLWHPYTIRECGHTLCQGCLIHWFDTSASTNVNALQYECPKCRTPVKRSPIENYTLKGIVEAIAQEIDPTSGPPAPQHQNIGNFGPWFRFFGR